MSGKTAVQVTAELKKEGKSDAEIAELVSWHCDQDADQSNESPEDNVAHVNGLVWQLCQRVLEVKE